MGDRGPHQTARIDVARAGGPRLRGPFRGTLRVVRRHVHPDARDGRVGAGGKGGGFYFIFLLRGAWSGRAPNLPCRLAGALFPGGAKTRQEGSDAGGPARGGARVTKHPAPTQTYALSFHPPRRG